MDAMAVPVGNFRISVLLGAERGDCPGDLHLDRQRIVTPAGSAAAACSRPLTPAVEVLASKLVRMTLLTLAVVLALGSIGIDLTAFAVFSGAVGVGVGFGLQKVVSNLVSGVILLLDRSIKPGDVIEIDDTYGSVRHAQCALCIGADPRRQGVSDSQTKTSSRSELPIGRSPMT